MIVRNNYQCPYCRVEFERPNILVRENSSHNSDSDNSDELYIPISPITDSDSDDFDESYIPPRQNNLRRIQGQMHERQNHSENNNNRNLRQSQRRILDVVNVMESISYEGIIIRIQFRFGRTYTLNTIRSNCSELIQRGNLQRIGRGGRVKRIR